MADAVRKRRARRGIFDPGSVVTPHTSGFRLLRSVLRSRQHRLAALRTVCLLLLHVARMVGTSIVVADGDHDTHTDDILSHSPAGVRRAKADAIACGESTVGAKIRDELGDLMSVLRGVDVLKALSNSDLSTLCDSLLRCMIPAGEIVMRQGERSSTFYLIVRCSLGAASRAIPAGLPHSWL